MLEFGGQRFEPAENGRVTKKTIVACLVTACLDVFLKPWLTAQVWQQCR